MTWWFHMLDDFVEHPKVMEISDRAFRLHVAGLCYTTRNLLDGHLPPRAVKIVCAVVNANRRHVVELRDADLWDETPVGGYKSMAELQEALYEMALVELAHVSDDEELDVRWLMPHPERVPGDVDTVMTMGELRRRIQSVRGTL